jgi:hypothetical protein
LKGYDNNIPHDCIIAGENGVKPIAIRLRGLPLLRFAQTKKENKKC